MYNLIIVEDEKIVRNALKDYITEQVPAYHVTGTFSNGEDAFSFLQDTHIDVVLTDIKMNRMDGLTLCEKIHQNIPHCHTIIISGFSTFEYARKALKFGVKEYLLKPIDFTELTDCLMDIKKTLDSETTSIESHDEDAALFFMELVSGSIKSTQEITEQIQKLNLDFLTVESAGYILRLSTPTDTNYPAWHYEKDRLPYVFTNVIRMSMENTYVNNFLTTGAYSYYAVIFKEAEPNISLPLLRKTLQELLQTSCNLEQICQFNNLTQLSFLKVLQHISISQANEEHEKSDVIDRIKAYINENYYKDISRQDIADMFYFSTAYFSRFFKKKVGMNFIDYLTNVRMEKAIELLNSRMSIDEISKRVGYNSRNHFIINFRQYTSMSPTEYRNQILKL